MSPSSEEGAGQQNSFPRLRWLVFNVPVSLLAATPSGLKSKGGAVAPGLGNPGLDAAIPLGLTSIIDSKTESIPPYPEPPLYSKSFFLNDPARSRVPDKGETSLAERSSVLVAAWTTD